jgi:hypothetical protein
MVLVLWYMHGDDSIYYVICMVMITCYLVNSGNVIVH